MNRSLRSHTLLAAASAFVLVFLATPRHAWAQG